MEVHQTNPIPNDLADSIARAAAAVRDAEAILVTAGAGMGVDSGLPDFRGPEGFWQAYPPYRALGLRFEQLANPATFDRDPHLAWGFYGHRLNLYRATRPHEGFHILRRWAEGKPGGYFAFTSNVDGHFQRSGFAADRVAECHGSIHHLQCAGNRTHPIRPADGVEVTVTPDMRAADPLPRCPACGGLARPNILLFGDRNWRPDRTDEQEARYRRWLAEGIVQRRQFVVIECGAGSAIPTVRRESENVADQTGAALVRINLREPDGPPGTIGLPMKGLEALRAMCPLVQGRSTSFE